MTMKVTIIPIDNEKSCFEKHEVLLNQLELALVRNKLTPCILRHEPDIGTVNEHILDTLLSLQPLIYQDDERYSIWMGKLVITMIVDNKINVVLLRQMVDSRFAIKLWLITSYSTNEFCFGEKKNGFARKITDYVLNEGEMMLRRGMMFVLSAALVNNPSKKSYQLLMTCLQSETESDFLMLMYESCSPALRRVFLVKGKLSKYATRCLLEFVRMSKNPINRNRMIKHIIVSEDLEKYRKAVQVLNSRTGDQKMDALAANLSLKSDDV